MNTFEISQLMHLTPEFYGVHPCCEIEVFRRKRVGSLIVNTDPHNKPGQHWVVVYIEEKTMTFFDSFGREINEFAEPFATIMNDFTRGYQVISNRKQYQNLKSDTCGLWSIYFILSKVLNVNNFHVFTEDTLRNETVMIKQLLDFQEIIKKKLM